MSGGPAIDEQTEAKHGTCYYWRQVLPAFCKIGSLRTRLDILKPDSQRCARVASLQKQQSERVGGSQRKMQDGEPVYLREFTNKRKWDSGGILQKLGSTNYKVRDTSGKEVHRHIDQLKRRSRSSLVHHLQHQRQT
ncbi:hypothetical protein ACJJTC_010766 [Scirpophaga incertulas]